MTTTRQTRTNSNSHFPTHQTEGFQNHTNIYHAQPYADAPGFYFRSYEEYRQKAERQAHIEEYELQFIDGRPATRSFSRTSIRQPLNAGSMKSSQ